MCLYVCMNASWKCYLCVMNGSMSDVELFPLFYITCVDELNMKNEAEMFIPVNLLNAQSGKSPSLHFF